MLSIGCLAFLAFSFFYSNSNIPSETFGNHVWLKGYLGISTWEFGSVCAKLFGIKSWKTGREIQMKASALSGFSFFP